MPVPPVSTDGGLPPAIAARSFRPPHSSSIWRALTWKSSWVLLKSVARFARAWSPVRPPQGHHHSITFFPDFTGTEASGLGVGVDPAWLAAGAEVGVAAACWGACVGAAAGVAAAAWVG